MSIALAHAVTVLEAKVAELERRLLALETVPTPAMMPVCGDTMGNIKVVMRKPGRPRAA